MGVQIYVFEIAEGFYGVPEGMKDGTFTLIMSFRA
jgi:hypothetical protein